jgi:hypothetical protein
MSFLQNDEISCCFETRVRIRIRMDPILLEAGSGSGFIEVKIQELSRLEMVPLRAMNALYGA